jgi:hypothetical protein
MVLTGLLLPVGHLSVFVLMRVFLQILKDSLVGDGSHIVPRKAILWLVSLRTPFNIYIYKYIVIIDGQTGKLSGFKQRSADCSTSCG